MNRNIQRTFIFSILTGILLIGSGCLSQKPLPYASVPRKLSTHGPKVTVLPIEDMRLAKDDLDEMLKIPECVEVVLVNELEGTGLFQEVQNSNSTGPAEYTLRVALEDLRWEVPNHDALVAKAFGISVATGGLGGLIYGSTDTDVLGHATFIMVLSRANAELINKRYVGLVKEERSKLNCDTPTTRREMAAKAVADALGQFKADLIEIEELKGNTEVVAWREENGFPK